jgi:prepilin-type processing-associated H-X9-DG protein
MRILSLALPLLCIGLSGSIGCIDPNQDKDDNPTDPTPQTTSKQPTKEKADDEKDLSATEQLRLAAARDKSRNNLKLIGLALHYSHEANSHFPGNITDKDGKPLLSWRVAILPYVEEEQLYKQFKLDEPWDSEHNKKLIKQMPKLYLPVRGEVKEGHTFYQSFTGKGAFLGGEKPSKLADITDGTSNTLMAVEAGEPVIWTKPEDISFDPKKELPKLGGLFGGGFNALLCDGSVRTLKKNVDPKTLKALITIAGGEQINLDN